MEVISQEPFSVTRDQARLVRIAARASGNYEVIEAGAHYQGVRMRMSRRAISKPDIWDKEKSHSAVLAEISQMGQLVDWDRKRGVDDLRYLYGPNMARAAMACVATAIESGLYDDQAQKAAGFLLMSYHDHIEQTARQ